jgi:hypothetical protein
MADETPGTDQSGESGDARVGTPAADATVQWGGGGRLEELMAKRRSSGLTDREAEELGRLMAEREGKPYSSAQTLRHRLGDE